MVNSLPIQKQNCPVGGRGRGGGYEEGIKQISSVSTNCDIFGAPGRLGAKPCIALKLPFFSSFISFASSSPIATDETNSQNCIIISIILLFFQNISSLKACIP